MACVCCPSFDLERYFENERIKCHIGDSSFPPAGVILRCSYTSGSIFGPEETIAEADEAVEPWKMLPQEIVDLIFQYLNDRDHVIVEQVCQSWLTSSRAHRNNLDISCYSVQLRKNKFTFEVLEAKLSKLSESLLRLHSINLEECIKLDDRSLDLISSRIPNLKKLKLSRAKVTNQGIKMVAERCANLQQLYIGGSELIDDEALQYLSQHSTQLEVLQLPNCYNVTSNGLQFIAQGCPQISELVLSCCDMVTNRGVGYLSALKNLKKLDLLQCTKLTDAALIGLVESVRETKLEAVVLYECEEIGDEGLLHLTQKSPNLRTLTLSNTSVTDVTLSNIATFCKNMQVLHLSRCPITSQGIAEVTEHCEALHTLILNNCKNVNDDAFSRLPLRNKKMNTLHLSGCNQITNRSLSYISKCPELTTLNINSCTKISDEGIAQLATGCEKLSTLTLNGNDLLTNVSLYVLAKHCPELRKLNLTQCSGITQEGISYLLLHHALSSLEPESQAIISKIAADNLTEWIGQIPNATELANALLNSNHNDFIQIQSHLINPSGPSGKQLFKS